MHELETPAPGPAGGSFRSEHPPDAVGGVTIAWLFESADLAISHWHCHEGRPTWSGEKAQLFDVVSFVHHGSFLVRDGAGQRQVDPASAVLLPAGQPYQTAHPSGCGDCGSAIAVRRSVLDQLAPELVERPSVWTGVVDSAAFLEHRLQVSRLRHGGADTMPLVESSLAVLDGITTQVRRGPASRLPSARQRRRERVEEVKVLLLQRLEQPVRLDDLAAAVGVSVFHLCRSFRAETGLPIHRYLQRLRLRAALAWAIEGASDLCAVAVRFGFSSHSHFTALFRKEFAMTPSAARRRGLPGVACRP